MTLELYLTSSGTAPLSDTDASVEVGGTHEWGGGAIPVFDYLTVTGKKLYVRNVDQVIDNPEDPEEDQTISDVYPTFYVQSVTLTPAIEPFVDYDITTQIYGITGTGGGWTEVGGIVDSTQYDYFRVFDNSYLSYLPFESVYDATAVVNIPLPADSYDPDNRIYPLDTVFTATPDGRAYVEVGYTLTIVWSTLSMEDTDNTGTTRFTSSFSVVDTMTQSGDGGTALVNMLAKSSFVAGYRPLKDPESLDREWAWFETDLNVPEDSVEHVTEVPD